MNEHLQFCKNYRTCYFREKINGESFNNNCYLVDRTRWLELSYRKGSFVATYKFDKATAETDDHQVITGLQAYKDIIKYQEQQIVKKIRYLVRYLCYGIIQNMSTKK